jgi:hypothetical protein
MHTVLIHTVLIHTVLIHTVFTLYSCSSNTGGLITSGGGFSLRAPRPAYQDAAVASFLKTSTTLPPLTEFNSSHR